MHDFFYVNDEYPLSTDVFDVDGVTPILPVSATIDVLNQNTGDLIVSNGICQVASGIATYYVLSGSTVSQTAGQYVGYMRVQIDATSAKTIALPFDVLSKSSILPVYRWRMKVVDAAPTEDHLSDTKAREWIDQAVDFLNRRYSTGYTSVLGTISPAPSGEMLELFTSIASLLARSAWWAGKGTWRDEEISFDAGPFRDEWLAIEEQVQRMTNDEWFGADMGGTVWNRDNVFWRGIKYDSPDYWYRTSDQPDPDTEIPI